MTKRILFVEDNEQLRNLFVELLTQTMDIVIIEAKNCAEGRQHLGVENFDALILDGNLPDGMGPELYVEFRDQLLVNATPVIIHSGEDARDLRAKFPLLEQDRILVLLKGVDDLDAALRQLLFP